MEVWLWNRQFEAYQLWDAKQIKGLQRMQPIRVLQP